jgi:hypothetical protein
LEVPDSVEDRRIVERAGEDGQWLARETLGGTLGRHGIAVDSEDGRARGQEGRGMSAVTQRSVDHPVRRARRAQHFLEQDGFVPGHRKTRHPALTGGVSGEKERG